MRAHRGSFLASCARHKREAFLSSDFARAQVICFGRAKLLLSRASGSPGGSPSRGKSGVTSLKQGYRTVRRMRLVITETASSMAMVAMI